MHELGCDHVRFYKCYAKPSYKDNGVGCAAEMMRSERPCNTYNKKDCEYPINANIVRGGVVSLRM
jgi:hypothetical protein